MTDDRLLTHADLRDIEARAEANYRILAPDVQSVPDTTWYVAQDNYPTNPLILAAPDAGWARGMVDELTRRDNDARLLLAHIRAQDAENARLRDALAALVDAEAHGTPGGYIGVDPSGETHDRHCTYCYTFWRMGEPERHDDDCPVAVARALLAYLGQWRGKDQRGEARRLVPGVAVFMWDNGDDNEANSSV